MPMPSSALAPSRHPKIVMAAVVAVAGGMLAATLPSPAAHAWGTGGDRKGHTGYGTHDWVVDQAAKIATNDGWFKAAVAVAHSGDPDVYFPRPTEHVYMEKGNGRGAAEQVSEWYVAAVRAFRAGNDTEASRAFGIMAHYYSDVTQPFHAKYGGGYKQYHRPYEVFTSGITNAAGAAPGYCDTSQSAGGATDVRRMTANAAAYSRQYFGKLAGALSKYRTSDPRMVKDSAVVDVTKRVLNRACGDLGKILQSIPTAAAMPATPYVKVRLIRTKLRIGQTPKVDVKITNSKGQPLDGVEFRVDWPGMKNSHRLYSLPNGVKRTHGVRALGRGKQQVHVTVLNPAGAASASVAASSTASATASPITVSKSYKVMTQSQLAKARKKARKAGKPWRP